MTLKRYQRGRGRVPVRIADALKSVRMKPSLLGETFFGNAGHLEIGAYALNSVCDHAAYKTTSECVFQASNHIGMGYECDSRASMERSSDDRRDILRAFINERSLKIARWAKESGVSANSIYNFLNGESEALAPVTYGKLARTAKVPVWRLSGEEPEPPSPTSVWVAGHVEAGSFREAIEWDSSLWYAVDVPIDQKFQGRAKALEVRGPSMNLEYRPGAIVIWVDALDYRHPRDGDHVIVYARAKDDGTEATVKELRIADGRRWLWPRSDHPEHQSPIDVDHPGDHIATIEIVGIVIGDYRIRTR